MAGLECRDVLADRGYHREALLELIRASGAKPHVQEAARASLGRPPHLPPRNLVEQFFRKLRRFRRFATRFDKLARNFLAAVALASVQLWTRAYKVHYLATKDSNGSDVLNGMVNFVHEVNKNIEAPPGASYRASGSFLYDVTGILRHSCRSNDRDAPHFRRSVLGNGNLMITAEVEYRSNSFFRHCERLFFRFAFCRHFRKRRYERGVPAAFLRLKNNGKAIFRWHNETSSIRH